MSKLVVPLLVVVGVVVGVVTLVWRRPLRVDGTSGRAWRSIAMIAAFVVGSLGGVVVPEGAGSRGEAVAEEVDAAVAPAEALAHLETRAKLLHKLQAEGKLTEEAFQTALAKMKPAFVALGKAIKDKETAASLEYTAWDVIEIRKAMQAPLIEPLVSTKSFAVLRAHLRALLRHALGKSSKGFDEKAALEALDDLVTQGGLSAVTKEVIATIITEVPKATFLAIEPPPPEQWKNTCYFYLPAKSAAPDGFDEMRKELGDVLVGIETKVVVDDVTYHEWLTSLAYSATCLSMGKGSSCAFHAFPIDYRRITMVQSLQLLRALVTGAYPN